MPEQILGISAFYHDSAAVLLSDGKITAAAHEERFSRKKHDPSFPSRAIQYVLEEGGIGMEDICAVAFYDKPYLKFERLLETYHGFAPKGLASFLSAIPVWIREKLFMKRLIRTELEKLGTGKVPQLLFPEHHLSHGAGAFFPSPFEEAAILTVDGVGEWATTTIGHGRENQISVLRQLNFPHSLGLLYSAFTSFCGFKVNSGEYKLMGLAPYGRKEGDRFKTYKEIILDELMDLREDGSFLLNMDYFNFATGLTMCREDKWERVFKTAKRDPETDLDQEHMDLALAVQTVTQEVVLRLARTAKRLVKSDNLVLAGGVALNCVANGILAREGPFKEIWIQPAAGDAGGALGAACAAWHIWKGKERTVSPEGDAMQGAYLGPAFGSRAVKRAIRKYAAPYEAYNDFDRLCKDTACLLDQGNVVGWFQGRMEYGPRALGNRSILGDPRHPDMQRRLNLKIKFREGFRPFAPSVAEEDLADYFDLDRPSPYMLLVAPVKSSRRNPFPDGYGQAGLYDRLYFPRSDIPAVTHVDYSARIQSVGRHTNRKYWKLIKAFKARTGCAVLVNTSFNVRGEPIVCTPGEAYACFMRTEMDYLVMGNLLFRKTDQPQWDRDREGGPLYDPD